MSGRLPGDFEASPPRAPSEVAVCEIPEEYYRLILRCAKFDNGIGPFVLSRVRFVIPPCTRVVMQHNMGCRRLSPGAQQL